MKRSHRALLTLGTVLLALVSISNSCEPYRTSSRKTSTLGNPKRSDTFFAVAKYAEISGLSVCLKELVLTDIVGEVTKVPYSSALEITIPATGMDLAALNVPPGQYTKIYMQLADGCGSGRSISITNSQGKFISTAAISLKFSGNEFLGTGFRKIIFDIQSLAAQLSQVSSDSGVPPIAAGSIGDYHSVGCGMQGNLNEVAFCETFDKPSLVLSRGGQLDPARWTVSRTGASNQGQGELSIWNRSTVNACGVNQPAAPDASDFVICNGQLRESTFDGGGITVMTMSPTQPFDFNGRKGTLAFDITNDTRAGVWPELWISDQYVPGQHSTWTPETRARNSLGIRFAGAFEPNAGGQAPGCVNDGNPRWIVDAIQLVRNFASEEIKWFDQNIKLTTLGCVISSSGANGKMNHIELRVAQDEIEIWASDAGSSVVKKIALLQNLALPFSRGYITFGDYHNNPSTYGHPELANHTFAWDNIAFDGPIVPRDVVASVLDNTTEVAPGVFSLGWQSPSSEPMVLNTLPLTPAQVAAAKAGGQVVLTTSFAVPFVGIPASIQYAINGVQLNAPIPFAVTEYARHAIQLPVPASALVDGSQVISIWAGANLIVHNVDVRLIGIGL